MKHLSVQINDKLYNMLKAYCDKHKMSMREFLEQVLYEYLELEKDDVKKEEERLFKIRVKIRRNKAYLRFLEQKIREYEDKATIYDMLQKVYDELEKLKQYANDYFYHIVGLKDVEDVEFLKSQIELTVKELNELLITSRQILLKIRKRKK